MNTTALTVSQLNFYIKSIFECDARLQRVSVAGEISNFTEHYKSGHMYFSVKDSASAIKAVMFRSSAAKLKFKPKDGMNVIITGRVSVFERDGQYQLYADNIVPDGLGSLAQAFEQLKEKLAAEGLFDSKRKKPIPAFPERIGVVTAKDGAAIRDIITVLGRRWPLAEIIMCPVLVQGVSASLSIANAIKALDSRKIADVIIVGRGGGSIEDLWAFNEEITVRAVADCSIPIISAVGHETDFTLCDFAADLRAPTPSAAAELAVPDILEMKNDLRTSSLRLSRAAQNLLSYSYSEVQHYGEKVGKNKLEYFLNSNIQYCDSLTLQLGAGIRKIMSDYDNLLNREIKSLDNLSPLKTLSRGYSICEKENKTVDSVKLLKNGDTVGIVLKDGIAACSVTEIKENIK